MMFHKIFKINVRQMIRCFLLGIFIINYCGTFSNIVLGTSSLLLKNNSVTIGLNFLLDSISAIILSNTVNTLLAFVRL